MMRNPKSSIIEFISVHLVATGFLLFLLVGIGARHSLFGSGTGAADDGTVSKTRSDASGTQRPAPVEGKSAQSPIVPPAPATVPVTAAPSRAKKESVPAHALTSTVDSVASPPFPAHDARPGRPAGPTADASPDEGQVEHPTNSAQTAPNDLSALLAEARSAYWHGQAAQAESLYLRYLSLRPEDAKVFVELGNLYRSTGRYRDALDAYYEAGLRYRAQGDWVQVRQAYRLLREADDPRAEALVSP